MNNENEVLKQLNILENNLLYLNDSNYDQDGIINNISASINTIKQNLIKQQEPKKYLTWEDLDFTKDTQCQKAKMNGKEYTLHYFVFNDTHKEVLIQNNDGSICSACNEQFFNELHLEAVE